MKVVVLGAGAVGAYYGGRLALAGHEVICFARGATLAAIRAQGLELRTPEGPAHAHVGATDRVDELDPADFAILAVKSYSLEEIAPAVRRMAEQGSAVVPFLNGVETITTLVRLGVPRAAVLGGVTLISVARVGPAIVERRSPFQIVIVGESDGGGHPSERVERIVTAFRSAGAEARSSVHIEVDLWQKFVFITTVAAVCGLARSPIGPLRDTPVGQRLLERAAREVVAVGRARGIGLPEAEVSRVMGVIAGLPPATKPSFLVDLESGARTELAVLSGAVSRFAEEAGLEAPVHDMATLALARR